MSKIKFSEINGLVQNYDELVVYIIYPHNCNYEIKQYANDDDKWRIIEKNTEYTKGVFNSLDEAKEGIKKLLQGKKRRISVASAKAKGRNLQNYVAQKEK